VEIWTIQRKIFRSLQDLQDIRDKNIFLIPTQLNAVFDSYVRNIIVNLNDDINVELKIKETRSEFCAHRWEYLNQRKKGK
jgi:hypothetical protein